MLSKIVLGAFLLLASSSVSVSAAEPGVSLTVTAFDVHADDTIDIGFEIENQSNRAVDLLYRLEVVPVSGAGVQGSTDVTEYKALNVTPHGTVRERFAYVAPNYVEGEQQLYVTVKTADGFPLSGILAGTGKFTSSPLPVSLGDCRLMDGAGGDVVPLGTPPVLTCMLRNTGKTEQAMLLSGDLSLWGDQAAEDRIVASADTVLGPGAEEAVTISFPALLAGGRYEGRAYLGNEHTRLSPVVEFSVWVGGANGHITRIDLDKEAYAPGEAAQVTVFSDRFPMGKDLRLAVALTDKTGASCATPVERALGSSTETFEFSLQAHCTNPKATAVLMASDGTVLDEAVTALANLGEMPGSGFSLATALGALGAGIFFVAVLAGYLIVRQRRRSLPLASALVFATTVALSGLFSAEASASTFSGYVTQGTNYAATCDGEGSWCPANFRIVGRGKRLDFYIHPSGASLGSITLSGSMNVNGSVTVLSEPEPSAGTGVWGSFRMVGNGNRIDLYGFNSAFAGSLSVTGGTVSGGGSANTHAWWRATGTNSITFGGGGMISLPNQTLTFTDTPPPACVNGVGPYTSPQPYTNAWCQARGYDVVTDTCLGLCACTAPRVWNGTACALPVARVDGVCGANSATPPSDPNRTMSAPPSSGACTSGTLSGMPVSPPTPPLTNFLTTYPATGALAPAWQWFCNGSGGGTNASCYVFQSAPAAPVTTFTGTYAGPPSQNSLSVLYLPSGGGAVTLNWSVANASGGSCTASAVPAAAGWTGAKPITGTAGVTVSNMTQFHLDCRNSSGTAAPRKTVTVYVYSDAICPASQTLTVGDPSVQLRYWRRLDGQVIDCANTSGASDLTADANATWSSTNGAIATVETIAPNKGRLTAAGAGSTAAQVAWVGRGTVASAPVTVNAAPVPTYAICPTGSLVLSMVASPTVQLRLWTRSDGASVDCANLSGSTDITSLATTDWESGSVGVATVDNTLALDPDPKGFVRALSSGVATMRARVSGTEVDTVTVSILGCIAYTCGTLPSAITEKYCPTEPFTADDSCGGTITCNNSGTRYCNFNWKEVQQ